MDNVTISAHTKDLFCIPCGGGFSCLGFDVATRQALAVGNRADELRLAADEDGLDFWPVLWAENAAQAFNAMTMEQREELPTNDLMILKLFEAGDAEISAMRGGV